jgi:hypothetical protein
MEIPRSRSVPMRVRRSFTGSRSRRPNWIGAFPAESRAPEPFQVDRHTRWIRGSGFKGRTSRR